MSARTKKRLSLLTRQPLVDIAKAELFEAFKQSLSIGH